VNTVLEYTRHLLGFIQSSDKLTFLAVGVTYTAFTFLLYEVLLLFLSYTISYSISFCAGIVFSASFNARYSFGVRLTSTRFFNFSAVYAAIYVAGLGLMTLCIEVFGVDPTVAPILVIVVLVPLNYLGSRTALAGLRRGGKS